jgi:hypothetical protein
MWHASSGHNVGGIARMPWACQGFLATLPTSQHELA